MSQRIPFQKALFLVEAEDADRGFADLTLGQDRYSVNVEREVFVPTVEAWMKKPGEAQNTGHDRSDVTALIPIAEETRKCEIRSVGRTAVFLTDNVIDFQAEKRVFLVDQTVLTDLLRPRNN